MRLFNDGQKKDLKSMGDTTFKRELLEELYKIDPGGGTPARISLEDTSEYFKTDSNAIFSAALGGDCQQNFNILMSDGFWNGSNPNANNTDQNGGTGNNDTIFDGNAAQSNDGGNYADTYNRTLADVAMKYYERDLRTDLANNVPTQPGVDEADQIAQDNAVLVSQAGPGKQHGGQGRITDIDGNTRRQQVGVAGAHIQRFIETRPYVDAGRTVSGILGQREIAADPRI